MATNPAEVTSMAAAMMAAVETSGGNVESFIKSVEGNKPATAAPKKDKVMTRPAPAAKATKTAKSPISRIYTDPVGKKVVVGDITFLIEEPISQRTNEPARSFKVVRSKGDLYLGRVIFAHEIDREALNYKVNRSVKAFDDKVALHALLRPLAVAAGLAKVAALKAKPVHKIAKGRDVVAKPVATPLVRMDTVVAPDSQPVANFGIQRLLSADEGKRVTVGAFAFVVEEGEHNNGPAGRRYRCVRSPDDFGLDNWVTDDDVRLRTSPRIPESVRGQLREAKITMHQLLRDQAIDAGLVKGKYAVKPVEAITDQVICNASIKDGIEGRYLVQHPDFAEDAILAVELEEGHRGLETQIILVRGNSDGLKGISAGTRIPHKLFMKRLRPEKMPKFVEVLADWLDEAVF